MVPLSDKKSGSPIPTVTYALIGLNVLIFLWDRGGALFGPSVTFSDLAMRPLDVVRAIRGQDDSFQLVTIFTSMFLHGGIVHLLGNMLYLLTFGSGVEWGMGSWRFSLYYLFWGVAAAAAQIFVDPSSTAPMVGASGAIGGALGAYFLLFPGNRLEILIPFVPVPVEAPAWALLGSWFLFQVFVRQEGVASWAHVGGFLAGMITILVMGGRKRALKDLNFEESPFA